MIKSQTFTTHWFWPLALIIGALNVLVVQMDGWQTPRLTEFGVVFDLALLLPVLYYICYRKTGQRALIRAIALACLGVWLAGHLVPDAHHRLIGRLDMVRYIGLGVLIIIELRLALEIWRLVARSESANTQQTVRQRVEAEGAPAWVAKLMAAEAVFWQRLLQRIRNLVRPRS